LESLLSSLACSLRSSLVEAQTAGAETNRPHYTLPDRTVIPLRTLPQRLVLAHRSVRRSADVDPSAARRRRSFRPLFSTRDGTALSLSLSLSLSSLLLVPRRPAPVYFGRPFPRRCGTGWPGRVPHPGVFCRRGDAFWSLSLLQEAP